MNYDAIYNDFIGKDKIQPISVTEKGSGDIWELKYREGKKIQKIECKSRDDLDKILIEFGGKNPETCKTESRFLELDGKWDSEDLNMLGHRITKVHLVGQRITRVKSIPLNMPKETGYQSAIQSRRNNTDSIMLKMKDKEDVTFTRSFSERTQFDALIEFLRDHPSLKDLKWFIRLIGTESRDTKKQCVWKRVQAGDGTKRMVLELREIDGKDFTECIRKDIFDSAGDMFDATCKRVKVKKKKEIEKNICLFAAEDGAVDLVGYEAAG